MQNYNPSQSSRVNFSDLQKKYFEEEIMAPEASTFFKKELFDYFISAEPAVKKLYRPYWLLNVYSTWNFLDSIGPDDVLDFVVAQTPDAIRLGYDVVEKLTRYMDFQFTDPDEMAVFYSEIRNKILGGEFFVDAAGKEMTMTGLVEQVRLLKSFANDTIRAAEFYEKTQRMLFAGTEKDTIYEYVIIDRRVAVERLIDLVNFVTTVEPDRIWEIVEATVFMSTAQVAPDEVPEIVTLKPVIPKAPAEAPKPRTETISPAVAALAKPAAAPASAKPPMPPRPTAIAAKPSYAEIKKKIEAVFPKDASGNFVDLDGAMTALEGAAEKYNDPKIAELLFFDEAENKFKWSV